MPVFANASVPPVEGPQASIRNHAGGWADDDEAADRDAHYDDYAPSWYAPRDGDKTRFIGPDGLPSLHLITYTDGGGGETVLRLCEDSTGLLIGPTDSRLPAAGVYVSRLRGEFYHQDACKAGDFSPGQPVTPKREPHNEFDRNAVAVYDATGHLGAYVNKQKARLLAKLIDAGEVRGPPSNLHTRHPCGGGLQTGRHPRCEANHP